eukprot:3034287-Pyramimonas_sp.AAC.1
MDGGLECVELDDGGLCGLEEAGWEASKEELEEAQRRKEALIKFFQSAAQQALGSFCVQAKEGTGSPRCPSQPS